MQIRKIKYWKISTKITMLYLVLSVILLSVLIPMVYFMVENSLKESLSANMQISGAAVSEAITEDNGTISVDSSALGKDTLF